MKRGILLLAASVIGLGLLQYLLPASFDNPAGVNHAGLEHFRGLIPIKGVGPLTVSGFSWIFRLLLATTWTGYGFILFCSYRDGTSTGMYGPAAIGALAVLTAFLFPPSLSSDVYAYAGWGRMWVSHGWNPYLRTLLDFAHLGDQAGVIAPVPASTTHGPVWLVIVCFIAELFRHSGLLAQVIALKLVQAGAVLAAAVAGRSIAGFYDARRADLALLAIGFNPVFLIEGPGSGHNDVLMAALMLGGIALCLKGRSRTGYLLLGLSVGIKFVTAAIVPWLILQQLSRRPPGKRLGTAVLAVVLVLAPIVIGFAVFRVQARALDGIKAIYARQTAGVHQRPSDSNGARAIPAASPLTPTTVIRWTSIVLVYVGLSIAVWRSPHPNLYLSCWAAFSLTLIIIGAPAAFAWYTVWPFSTASIAWDRFGVKVNLASAVLAGLLLTAYTVPYVR